jgi:hypothetical protein
VGNPLEYYIKRGWARNPALAPRPSMKYYIKIHLGESNIISEVINNAKVSRNAYDTLY